MEGCLKHLITKIANLNIHDGLLGKFGEISISCLISRFFEIIYLLYHFDYARRESSASRKIYSKKFSSRINSNEKCVKKEFDSSPPHSISSSPLKFTRREPCKVSRFAIGQRGANREQKYDLSRRQPFPRLVPISLPNVRENIRACLVSMVASMVAHIILPLPLLPPLLLLPLFFRGESRNETRKDRSWKQGRKEGISRGKGGEGGWRTIMYHFDDPIGELREFSRQREWIYDGAWKLTADPAPSGGIHSCTFQRHNSRAGGIYPGFRDVME